MKEYKNLSHKNQEQSHKNDKKAIRKIIKNISKLGWNANENDIELDDDWGLILLAGKSDVDFGYILRRVKPFRVQDENSLAKANEFQKRWRRKDLIEVFPYTLIFDENRNVKVKLLKPLFDLS